MADSMCGPSNAAKGLVAHASRDRSMHQDRFVGTPAQGSSNFRSQAAFGQTNGEADFRAFQSGMAPQMMSNAGNIQALEPAHAGFHPVGISPQRSMPHMDAMNATAFQQFMATQPQNQTDAQMMGLPDQLGRMSMTPAPQAQFAPQTYQPTYQPAYQQSQYASMSATGFGMGGAYTPMSYSSAYGQGHMQQIPGQSLGTTSAPVQLPMDEVMDDAAFERAFGEIEDAAANDQDFSEAMNDWMHRHGPAAAETQIAAEPPAQAEADLDIINQTDTNAPAVVVDEAQLAAEEEALAKRREQADLVRAASDIIESVKDNESDKFKKSSFIDLMRRIRAQEVVVEANAFIDSETGAVVVSRSQDDDDVEGLLGGGPSGGGGGASDGKRAEANAASASG